MKSELALEEEEKVRMIQENQSRTEKTGKVEKFKEPCPHCGQPILVTVTHPPET